MHFLLFIIVDKYKYLKSNKSSMSATADSQLPSKYLLKIAPLIKPQDQPRAKTNRSLLHSIHLSMAISRELGLKSLLQFLALLILLCCPIVGILGTQLFGRQNNVYEEGRTRSLTGGLATNGSNETVAMVLTLMRVGIMEGYAVRRIKAFNDRVFLSRYRRSYWFGTRYYALDNNFFLDTRETCAYRMREAERNGLEYEEKPEEPILDIIYQCQKYAQYCCGLDCCNLQ